ncbi:MAG: hypothetical protein MI976_04615 [Pseudomonadales bacterium]|nr:hypothetical protein [Pseudomonadales bacterium]
MNKLFKTLLTPIAAGSMALTTTAFSAKLPKRTLCVWDILGRSGPHCQPDGRLPPESH